MEQLNKSIEAKLQLCNFRNAQTSSMVEKQDDPSVERLRNTLAKKVENVHNLKVSVQELRFEAGHKEGEILTWSADLETKLDVGVVGKDIDSLDVTIKEPETNKKRKQY